MRFLLGGPPLDVSLTLSVSLGGPRLGGRRGRHWSLARQQHQYLVAVGNGRELFHAPNPGRKLPSACTPSTWACSWRCCSTSTCPGAPLPPPSRSSSSTSRTPAPASRSCGLMMVILFYLDELVPPPSSERMQQRQEAHGCVHLKHTMDIIHLLTVARRAPC